MKEFIILTRSRMGRAEAGVEVLAREVRGDVADESKKVADISVSMEGERVLVAIKHDDDLEVVVRR